MGKSKLLILILSLLLVMGGCGRGEKTLPADKNIRNDGEEASLSEDDLDGGDGELILDLDEVEDEELGRVVDEEKANLGKKAYSAGEYVGLTINEVSQLVGQDYQVDKEWNSSGFYFEDLPLFFLIGELMPEGKDFGGNEKVYYIYVSEGEIVPGVHVGSSAEEIGDVLKIKDYEPKYSEYDASEGNPPYMLIFDVEINGAMVSAYCYFTSPTGKCEFASVKKADPKSGYMVYQEEGLLGKKMVDLNGDGKEEEIKIFANYYEYGILDYRLEIGQASLGFTGEGVETNFNIVDIFIGDKYKEVAISEYGASDDYMTEFFRYDGKKIISLGKISGFYGEMISYYLNKPIYGDIAIEGDGLIKTQTRGEILHTWYHDDLYILEENRLRRMPQNLYQMNSQVTVLKDLQLKAKKGSNENGIILRQGEIVTIKDTDGKSWCSVVNSKGGIGWFEVEDFSTIKTINLPAWEVFDGLFYAD